MKKILPAILILILYSFNSYSQKKYEQISIGLMGGITTAYTGLSYGLNPTDILAGFNPAKKDAQNRSRTYGINADYYFSPYLSAGAEFSKVRLRDGTDQYNRAFKSRINSLEFRGTLGLGQFFQFSQASYINFIRNIYTSIGIGLISGTNNVSDFDPNIPADAEEPFPRRQHMNDEGKSEFKNVLSFPLALGYNINFRNQYDEPKVVLGLQTKFVFTKSDDLDGFSDKSAIYYNESNDVYTTVGVSLKYNFGTSGLFYKK